MNPYNDPRILEAARRLALGDPMASDGLSSEEHALAYYLGRVIIRLSALVRVELLLADVDLAND